MLRRTPLLLLAFLSLLVPVSGIARAEDETKQVVLVHGFSTLAFEERVPDLEQLVKAIVPDAATVRAVGRLSGAFLVKAPKQAHDDLSMTMSILRRTLHDVHPGEDREHLMKRAIDEALANGRTLAALRSTILDFSVDDGPCTAVLEQIAGRGDSRSFDTFVSPKATQRLRQKRVKNLAIEHTTARHALTLLMVLTGLEWSLTGRGVLVVHTHEEAEALEDRSPRKVQFEVQRVRADASGGEDRGGATRDHVAANPAVTPDVLEAIRALHEEVRALRAEVAALAEALGRDG